MTLNLEKHYNWTQKRLQLGKVSSFDPHNMCAKVERITAKIGCTSCTNWTISFKVQGFQTKTHLLQRHFIFLNFFELKTFWAFNMHHSKPHTKIWTLSHFICYFHAFNDLFCAKWTWKWKAFTNELRKGCNLAWYHHLTRITCVQKLRGLPQKLDALRVQTGASPSKCEGFRLKLICYKGISFF